MVKLFCAPVNDSGGSLTVYALLEYAFRREFGCNTPEIKKTPVGKPYFPDRSDIHFSLSHSRTHVLCGLADRPIGVDIESPRVLRDRVIEFFSSPEESKLFSPLELWVLKESYIKLIGGSLPLVKTIRFSRNIEYIVAPEKTVAAKLYSIEHCTAAVCVDNDSCPDSFELITPLAI